MILLPAIDLMDGCVVRLQRGEAAAKTVYSDDPVGFARRWQDEGGDYLHIDDLDAAFRGEPRNQDCVRAIVRHLDIPVECGGGLRSRDSIRMLLDAGVGRVVVGTRAAESVEFVASLVEEFGGGRIAVGIDARDGVVAVKGWTESSGVQAAVLAREVEQAGASTIIYTDIATDGMLQGPNIAELETMLGTVDCQLIASGGVSSLADIERLAGLRGLHGAIIGKALYDGKVSLPDAKRAVAAAAAANDA